MRKDDRVEGEEEGKMGEGGLASGIGNDGRGRHARHLKIGRGAWDAVGESL